MADLKTILAGLRQKDLAVDARGRVIIDRPDLAEKIAESNLKVPNDEVAFLDNCQCTRNQNCRDASALSRVAWRR